MEKATRYQPINDDEELRSSGENEDSAFLGRTSPRALTQRRSRVWMITYATAALVVWTAFVSFVSFQIAVHQRLFGRRFLSSPANDYISYEPKKFVLYEKGAAGHSVVDQFENHEDFNYFTDPSPEIDARWEDLLKYSNLAVDPQTIKDLGIADITVQFPDGTYYGEFMVMHHLHCLKTIYHGMYPEYYNKTGLTPEQKEQWHVHTGHCLSALKQAVMCQGDVSLFTMQWVDYHPKPIGRFLGPHECVNWDLLMEYAAEHSVDPSAEGMLIHPKFGPVFHDGELVHYPGVVDIGGH